MDGWSLHFIILSMVSTGCDFFTPFGESLKPTVPSKMRVLKKMPKSMKKAVHVEREHLLGVGLAGGGFGFFCWLFVGLPISSCNGYLRPNSRPQPRRPKSRPTRKPCGVIHPEGVHSVGSSPGFCGSTAFEACTYPLARLMPAERRRRAADRE